MAKTRRSKAKFHEFILSVDRYNIEITVPVYCDKQGSRIDRFFTHAVVVNPPGGEAFVVDSKESSDITVLYTQLNDVIKDRTKKTLVFNAYEGPVKLTPCTRNLHAYLADLGGIFFDLEDETKYKEVYNLLDVQQLRYFAIDENGLVYEKSLLFSTMNQRVSVNIDEYTMISEKDLKDKVKRFITLLEQFYVGTEKLAKTLHKDVEHVNKSMSVNHSDLSAETELLSILRQYQ